MLVRWLGYVSATVRSRFDPWLTSKVVYMMRTKLNNLAILQLLPVSAMHQTKWEISIAERQHLRFLPSHPGFGSRR